jgi:hypothetical protein
MKLNKKVYEEKNCKIVLFYLTEAIPGITLQYFAYLHNTRRYLAYTWQY